MTILNNDHLNTFEDSSRDHKKKKKGREIFNSINLN